MSQIRRRSFVVLLPGIAAAVTRAAHAAPAGALVLVGTYTGPKSEGIYAFRFDPATGALTPQGLAARTESPAFLARHPREPWVFAVNEVGTFEGQSAGAVSGFVDPPGSAALTPTNTISSRGPGPCHLAVDPSGRFVYVANYTGGNLAVLPIDDHGRLGSAIQTVQHAGSGPNRERQEGPHAHQVVFSPDGRLLLAVDLGADRVFLYTVDRERGTLKPHEPASVALPAGSGPRHLTFDPAGRHAYVISELASTITAFDWDAARGVLTSVQQVSTLPAGFAGESTTAEIAVHPSGRFLFGSNRGHDSLALFAIDQTSGRLRFVAHTPTRGRTPRHFAFDPTGRWLIAANQNSDTLAVFRVDDQRGRLDPAGRLVSVGSPVCVLFAT